MRRIAVALIGFTLFAGAPLAAQSSTSNFTSAIRYDAHRQIVGTISADPDGTWNGATPFQAVRNTYDAGGKLIKVERGSLAAWQSDAVDPANWSGFTVYVVMLTTYDDQDRKTSEAVLEPQSAGGAIRQFTQYSYDAVGRLECTAVRMNPATFGSLATGACSLTTTAGNGPDRITRNVYDASGQLLTVQKAYGTSVQQNYAGYTYSANGKQATVTDANGNVASLSYDGFDRLSQWNFPSKTSVGTVSSTDYEAYGYDANGNRTSVQNRDGRSIQFAYDGLDRLIAKTFPSGGARAVYYDYDLRGLQTAARFDSTSGSDAVLSSWDGFGRQVTSTTAMSGTSRTLNYQYNADGKRTRVTYPDGVYVNFNQYDTNQLYYADINGLPLFHTPLDGAGRVFALYRLATGSGTWAFGTGFQFDNVSRLSSYNHFFASSSYNVTTTFAYNPANQVVSQSRDSDGYAFNGYVNVNREYATNGLNQYTTAGPASFTYDANGNLLSDGTSSFGYDIENRLISSTNGATLTYDPTGRLWQTAGTANGTTRFLYDGDALVAEYDGAGNMLKRYVHGEGADDPLAQYTGAGIDTPSYLFSDHHGSIMALTDANGNVNAVNRYDEYGIPGAGNSGRFQYTGQAWLPDLGMYFYKARIYSPTLGRFLQTDPIGYDDQINLYAYVGNDPINATDPDGTDEVRQCFGRICGSSNDDPRGDRATWANAVSRSEAAGRRNLLMPQGDGNPRGGDTGPQRQSEIDDHLFLSGNLSQPQLQERRQARAEGALTGSIAVEGVAIVRGGVAVARAGAAGVRGGLDATKNFFGPRGPVIGRTRLGGSSIFGINSNNVLRFGWGWKGGAQTGNHVLRISGDWVRAAGFKSGHIDLLKLSGRMFP